MKPFDVVIGMDPSFTGFGIAHGERTERIATAPTAGLPDAASTLLRCEQIAEALISFLPSGEQLWVVEAPMLRVPAHGGSHLYQLGFLMSRLYRLSLAYPATIIEVPNATLLKTLFGTGRIDKAHLALAAFRSFGIGTLEADPGLDRLFALLLARYGTLCSGGLHEHAPAKKRSSRKRAPVVE